MTTYTRWRCRVFPYLLGVGCGETITGVLMHHIGIVLVGWVVALLCGVMAFIEPRKDQVK